MSEQPQGPGWWLASDGRYYPPQQQPGYPPPQPQYPPQQPTYPPQQPGYPAQPYRAPAPQPARRGGGCLKTALVVFVVLIVVFVVGGYFAVRWLGEKGGDLVGVGDCTITTNAVVTKALETPVTLQKGSGLGGVVSGIIDSRVLPKATSCYGVSSGSDANLLVRIASTTTPGAKTQFAGEVKNSKGVVVSRSTDGQGGSTQVETDPYYGGPVSGLGDEAFCTTLNGTGAIGVLVRKGDRLVYASVGGTTQASGIPLVDQKTGCARAQKLARAVLAG